MRWKASQERGVSTAEGTGPLQPEAQAGAAPNVVRADTSLRGSTGRGLGRQGDGAGREHWPSSGTSVISSSLGMKAGLGFPIPRGPGYDDSSAHGEAVTQGTSLLMSVDARTLEAKNISKFTNNKSHKWTSFKRDIERYAYMWGFGEGLFQDPPLCVDPLDEPQLLGLGVSRDDVQRARFGYMLLFTTVKDPIARHSLLDARSPSIAWRMMDEQFSPITAGAKMDMLDELNNIKYSKGQDTDEFWVQILSVHKQSTELGLEIPPEMVVDKFINSLPAEYTTVRDQLCFEPDLLTDKTRAVVKDKFLSLKKIRGV